MSTQKLSLVAYNTEKGLYYANSKWNYLKKRDSICNVTLLNGKPLVESEHKSDWYFLEGESEITSIKKNQSGGYGEASWVLRDESTHIDGVIPKVLTPAEADEIDEDCDWYIGSESKYHAYRGLYHRVKERLPDVMVDVEFEVDYKGTIEHTLVENMKLYLGTLMDTINAPVHECESCGGLGCTYDKVDDINIRGSDNK